ncbi:10542_t:CDS:2, partial [Paraglomus brasilianum]
MRRLLWKFWIRFLADENLGSYTLDIVGFVKQNDDGIFENGVFSELGEGSGGGTQGELQIEAKFFSSSLILEDKFVFSQATVDEHLLYILISWRRPDNRSSFPMALRGFSTITESSERQISSQ